MRPLPPKSVAATWPDALCMRIGSSLTLPYGEGRREAQPRIWPGQRVEVNKIVSDFVTRSLAVEFRCCRTRMTCNFPSYLAPQNVLGGRNGKRMPRLSPTLT